MSKLKCQTNMLNAVYLCNTTIKHPLQRGKQRQSNKLYNMQSASSFLPPLLLCYFEIPYLWIFHVIILLSSYPFLCQSITNCVTKGSEIIPIRSNISVLDQREMQVSVEAFLHVRYVLDQRYFAKRYRLFLFQITLRSLCHVLAGCESTPLRQKNKQN